MRRSTRSLRRAPQVGARYLRNEAAVLASAVSRQGLGTRAGGANHRRGAQIGYQRMRLDTVEPVMKDAVAMYRKLGFKEIAPYRPNPNAGAMYMELKL